MFLLHKPSASVIQRFVAAEEQREFSYPVVDASRNKSVPVGYTVDHHRIKLGDGREAFARAIEAVRGWQMFHLAWVQLCWPNTPIRVGATVGVLASHLGFWSLNACRIVYLVEEDGLIGRYGFAYGTLSEHVESGEERFVVEWNREDDSVWYDLFSFAKGNSPVVKIGYPIRRMLQRRFARDSMQAMVEAVTADDSQTKS